MAFKNIHESKRCEECGGAGCFGCRKSGLNQKTWKEMAEQIGASKLRKFVQSGARPCKLCLGSGDWESWDNDREQYTWATCSRCGGSGGERDDGGIHHEEGE